MARNQAIYLSFIVGRCLAYVMYEGRQGSAIQVQELRDKSDVEMNSNKVHMADLTYSSVTALTT